MIDFENVYREYFPRTVYFFRMKGFSREEAEELAQDVFFRVYRYREQYKGRASEKTWISKIQENVFKNELRRRKALKRPQDNRRVSGSDEEDRLERIPEPASAGDGILGLLVHGQQMESLREAIDRLPPRMRQCVRYRLQGLSHKEAARLMDITPNTVKRQVHDAKKLLRDRLTGDARGEANG